MVKNNADLAKEKMEEMYYEYYISESLTHPNVVEYKYFVRKYDPSSLVHEFHIIMELMDGPDMEAYI